MDSELTKPNQNTPPESERTPEGEAESQKYSRRESLSDELINSAETPEELFIGLRQLEKQLEDGNIPQNLSERYTPPRQLSAMYERADMLGYKIDDMIKRGWIKDYNPETGEAKLKDERFSALAIKTERVERINGGGRYIGYETKYNFGTTESREILEKAYRRAITELEARDIMGEHIGVRLNIQIRDSLELMVETMHGGRIPKFKADHLETIFNMPSLAEMETNPENHQLGDQVEEAMFLNLVMLNSGSKLKMLDFLERPGSKHLIAKIAKEWGVTYDQWMSENIGDVNKWKSDENRLLTDDGDTPATWREEASNGLRGTLTKYSNIAAWGGKSGEFSLEKETEFIEKTIGGMVGSVEASWIAATMMRITGTYATEGHVALLNGKTHMPLGEGRFISGDDTGKFFAYMFNMKEGLKGRTSGLREMVGRIPDMAMNLFDWAQVVVGKNPNGTDMTRSIWDAWLGTAGGRKKIDILTGELTNDPVAEEGYHRLGDINFKSLEREFHATFTIMQWLMGSDRAPTGVLIDALNVDDFKSDDFGLNALKKKWKYIGIVMNPIALTRGSMHLYDLGKTNVDQISTFDLADEGVGKIVTHEIKTKSIETIQRRFLINLLAARIRSSLFATDIFSQSKKIFNLGTIGDRLLEVPMANLIRLNVKEVFKASPTNEAELVGHYTDDLTRMQELVSWKNAGILRDEARMWITNDVGIITGKKSRT